MLQSGALRVPASIARTGVQIYRAGGEEWGELRLPEEVFAPASLETLRGVPVTVGHEGSLVKPESWHDQAHGHAGDTPRVRDPWLETDLVICRAETIADVRARRLVEISSGYLAKNEHNPGSYLGQPYEFIQRNIRHNHITLLPPGTARAGAGARIHLDAGIPQLAIGLLMKSKIFRLDTATATAYRGDQAYKLTESGVIDTLRRDLLSDIAHMDEAHLENPEKLRELIASLEPMLMGLVEIVAQLMTMVQEQASERPPETLEQMESVVGPEVMDAALVAREEITSKARSHGIDVKGKSSIAIMKATLAARGCRLDGLDDDSVRDFYDRVPNGSTWSREDRKIVESGSGESTDEFATARAKNRLERRQAWAKQATS